MKRQNVACFRCRKNGHRLEDCPQEEARPTQCFNCGSVEHALRDCHKPRVGGEQEGMDREVRRRRRSSSGGGRERGVPWLLVIIQ